MSTNQFQIEYNGITVGGNTQYPIGRLEGFYGMPIRQSDQNLPGRDGGNIFIQKYPMRVITLEGRVWGNTSAEYFTKIQSLIDAFTKTNTTNEMAITKWDGNTLSLFCKVTGEPEIIENRGEQQFANFRIELTAEDPFFVSNTEQTFTASPASATGFPLSAPLSMPLGQTVNGTMVITNNGDVDTYPQSVVITGELTNPSLLNTATGEQFTIERTLGASDSVTITKDTDGLEVLLNGTTNIFSDFVGDFPIIQVGANTLKFNASTNVSGGITITYRDKYKSLAA